MTNKKVTRRALLMSVTSLLICISMLLGTTFAWFTDEVTSGVNKIVAGNLDVELYHQTSGMTEAAKVTADELMFNSSTDTNMKLWEPGAMAYEIFTVKNVGSLALKYKMNFNKVGNNYVVEANGTTTERSLLDVLRVAVIENVPSALSRADIVTAANGNWTTLKNFESLNDSEVTLKPKGSDNAEKTFLVA